MTTMDIIDWETDETVATVSDDGTWQADTPLAEEVLNQMFDKNNTVGWRTAKVDSDTEETAEIGFDVAPGDDGYLYAVADALPSPLTADPPDDAVLPKAGPGPDDGVAQKMWDDLVNLAEKRLS